MRNCMKADLIRVQKKKSFILMAVITLVILSGAFLLAKFLPGKGGFSSAFSMYMGMGTGTFSLLMGIPVFLAVYSDDFKSKAMQTAIGFGVSRTKLIICRFLEIISLLIECAVVFSVVVMIFGLAGGADWSAIGSVLKSLWLDVYTSLCYCSIAIIIVYIM